jgi:hypothetical protein
MASDKLLVSNGAAVGKRVRVPGAQEKAGVRCLPDRPLLRSQRLLTLSQPPLRSQRLLTLSQPLPLSQRLPS